ncbi:MAG TPA: hypothetical protein VF701_13250 [Thermoanaerobaculia bacterium]
MRRVSTLFATSLLVVFLSACNGKVTGGGTIPSVAGDDSKAAFTLTGDSCKGKVKGKFTLVDQKAAYPGGLRLSGDSTGVMRCLEEQFIGEIPPCTDCPAGTVQFSFDYKSNNKSMPGDGRGFACVTDNGQGRNGTPDLVSVTLVDGPYIGYTTGGELKGNLRVSSCKDDELPDLSL